MPCKKLRFIWNVVVILAITILWVVLLANSGAAQDREDVKIRLGEGQLDEGRVGSTNPMPVDIVSGGVGGGDVTILGPFPLEVEIVAPLPVPVTAPAPLDVEVINGGPIDVNVVSGGAGGAQLGPLVEIAFADLNADHSTYATVTGLGYVDETYVFVWNNTDVPVKLSYDGGTTDHAIIPPFFWGTFPVDEDATDVELIVVGTATEGELYIQVGK